MALSDSAGLLFKIRADGSQAKREIRDVKDEVSSSSSGMASAFSGLAGPAAIAGAAIAGIATAAASVGMTLFNLAQSASEFGSEIFDAGQKTGLSAERLSAFKFAADQSGTSLDAVTGGFARFSKTIGEAANGSDKAQAKMAALGVTSTDLDTALSQALATIVKLEPGTAQMNAAMEAFGRTGADLLPFIRSFDGDMEALTRTAKELGVTIDDETARAADEFGDSLDTLTAQLAGVGRAFGNELMPVFQAGADYISDWLSRNQGEIRSWGQATADVISGLIQDWNDASKAARDYGIAQAAAFALRITLPGMLLERWRQQGAQDRMGGESAGAGMRAAPGAGFPMPTGGARSRGGGRRSGQSEAEKRAREEQRLADRDEAAHLRLMKDALRDYRAELDKLAKTLEDKFNRTGDVDAYTAAIADGFADAERNINNVLAQIERLENANLDKMTHYERLALASEQLERREAAKADLEQKRADARNAVAERDEKNAVRAMERFDEQMEQARQLLEIEEEKEKQAQESRAEIALWLEEMRVAEEELAAFLEYLGDPFADWTDSWHRFIDEIQNNVGTLQDALGNLSGIFQNAFQGFADAIGNVVQQWVLYGETGPAVMRKVLAAALATIAADAAVQAIYATALGFIRLAQWDFAGAANAFTSAALFAGVAGAAAIAGRAIAGDSFKKQTSASTGGSRAAAGSSGGGRPQTQTGDTTVIEAGRNRPENNQANVHITLGLDSEGVLKVIDRDVRSNGTMRGLIIDTAAAG